MNRPWNILEQVIVEPAVKLRFEFTSEHSKALASGEEPPYHDRAVVLNVYNESGTRVIRMSFTRGGEFNGSEVEENTSDVPRTEQEELAAMMDRRNAEPPTAVERGLPADPGWAETNKEEAWQGVNLAQRFVGDIE